jgi:hypothetical protein
VTIAQRNKMIRASKKTCQELAAEFGLSAGAVGVIRMFSNDKEKCAYHQQLRERKKAQGLCECGKRAVNGRRCCYRCLVKQRMQSRQKRANRKAKGFCQCGKRAVKGKILCQGCAKRCNFKVRKKKAALRIKGLCHDCGKYPAVTGRIRCSRCLKKLRWLAARRYVDLKSKGLCTACGKRRAIRGQASCARCRAIHDKGGLKWYLANPEKVGTITIRRQMRKKGAYVGCDQADALVGFTRGKRSYTRLGTYRLLAIHAIAARTNALPPNTLNSYVVGESSLHSMISPRLLSCSGTGRPLEV